MKDYVPNAKHVFIDRDSALRSKRIFVVGQPSPVSVSTLLKEVAAAWEHELPGGVPHGLGAAAFRECLLIASQAVDRALDAEIATSVLHDAKNMIRNACETIENVKSEISYKQNRRLQKEIDASARALADLADLCTDLLHKSRHPGLALPVQPPM